LTYIFHDDAGNKSLKIKADLFKYLVKVRRHVNGDKIDFRSRQKLSQLYTYEVVSVEPRSIELNLVSSSIKEVKSKKSLHIGWCLIDSKSIEKVLPSLCEVGVKKISFIYCDRSQKNFKVDFNRFERILEASMQQSGRSDYIEFNTYKDIKEFIIEFPDTKVFDFCDKILEDTVELKTVLIGCEGGFSSNERMVLSEQDTFRLDTAMILRSESAVIAVASKLLL